MTIEQSANTLRAVVIDTMRQTKGTADVEVDDFTEQYRSKSDPDEQLELCRVWLKAYRELRVD